VSKADEFAEAITDLTIRIADAADEADLDELTDEEAQELRTEAERLAAAIETLIEAAQPSGLPAH